MAAYELDLDQHSSAIARLTDWVGACGAAEGLADELTFKLTLALEEGVTNVLGYAFDGMPLPHRVSVRLDITEHTVAAEIVDNGRPFDPTVAEAPDLSLSLEERDPGGLGIHLIRSLMDLVQYRRIGGTNILRLEKSRG